jgi:hypothetical protein
MRSIARIAGAGIGMGIAVAGFIRIAEAVVEDPSSGMQLVVIAGAVLVGVVVYLALARMLRVEELQLARGIVTRRAARRP